MSITPTMTITMTEDSCILVLKDYLYLMNKWEEKWIKIAEKKYEDAFTEDNLNLRRSELAEIFNRFLSKKTLAGGQSRLINLAFSIPPQQHDVSITKIESKNKRKYQIYVVEKIGKLGARYDLIWEDENWKLDNVAYEALDWRAKRTVF